jgi:hypothetical protein
MKLAKQNVTCIFSCHSSLPAPRRVWNALPAANHVCCLLFVPLHSCTQSGRHTTLCPQQEPGLAPARDIDLTINGQCLAFSLPLLRETGEPAHVRKNKRRSFKSAYWQASCQLVTSPVQSIAVEIALPSWNDAPGMLSSFSHPRIVSKCLNEMEP